MWSIGLSGQRPKGEYCNPSIIHYPVIGHPPTPKKTQNKHFFEGRLLTIWNNSRFITLPLFQHKYLGTKVTKSWNSPSVIISVYRHYFNIKKHLETKVTDTWDSLCVYRVEEAGNSQGPAHPLSMIASSYSAERAKSCALTVLDGLRTMHHSLSQTRMAIVLGHEQKSF